MPTQITAPLITPPNLSLFLAEKFGLKAFRPGQEEAITALLNTGRVLCIQPTGHGKSLIYQLTACLLPGITVVISPLLALMRDQIQQLGTRFKIPAASINSDQTEEENALARLATLSGHVRILFLAPEQLDHLEKLEFLLNLPISLVVVDEAHCISTWGHDFRPSYRQILHFTEALQKKSDVRILGLTATAEKRVEDDVKRQLSSPTHPVTVLRANMDRPNISLSVIPASGTAEKLAWCETLLKTLEGCGLVYCATRENTELVADYLKQRGINATAYHAGFASEEKRVLQQAFTSDTYKVLVATTALGMGIDKSNLRYIIHFDIPGSITAYYQEVGRCGRDGLPAKGILLLDPADKKIQEYFIASALPTREDFDAVLKIIQEAEEAPNLYQSSKIALQESASKPRGSIDRKSVHIPNIDRLAIVEPRELSRSLTASYFPGLVLTLIKRLSGLHPTRVTIVVAELIEQGFIFKEAQNKTQVYKPVSRPPSTPINLSRFEDQNHAKKKELQNMMHYAEQNEACRMALLRQALGDTQAVSCMRCDVCQPHTTTKVLQKNELTTISSWLDGRPISISSTKQYAEGVSILDSKLRSPLFAHFMRLRTAEVFSIDEKLLDLLKEQLTLLAKKHAFAAIVPIPSQTWKGRLALATILADHMSLPLLDLLSWKAIPPKRQGELLNNDQRHHNVQQLMQAERLTLSGVLSSKKSLLLFDDYMGSGATLKEAARALRASGSKHELVPFTVATVKWCLGKTGFV